MSNVPGVIDAFNELRVLASRGTEFRIDQVWSPEPANATIFGVGYDFTEEIEIPDIVEGQTATATAAFRVIMAADGSLFLRQRLTWTTSDGMQHISYAHYQITATAAERLGATDVEPSGEEIDFDSLDPNNDEDVEHVAERLFERLDKASEAAEPYQAVWRQTYPGYSYELDDEAMVILHDQHHEAVITSLGDAGTVVTCMLSILDMGAVEPQELLMMAEWMRAQPQLAG